MVITGSGQEANVTSELGAAMSAGAEGLRQDLTVLARAPGVALDRELLSAYAASAAANSLRAFRGDVTAFDSWCHARGSRCLPASPQLVAGFLQERAGEGAAPASLTRYRCPVCDTAVQGHTRTLRAWDDADDRLLAIVTMATIANVLLLAVLALLVLS